MGQLHAVHGDEPVGEYLKRAHHLSSDLLFSSILFYSIPFYSIPFHSNFIDQDSAITAEAITMQKDNMYCMHPLLIVIVELKLFFNDSEALCC